MIPKPFPPELRLNKLDHNVSLGITARLKEQSMPGLILLICMVVLAAPFTVFAGTGGQTGEGPALRPQYSAAGGSVKGSAAGDITAALREKLQDRMFPKSPSGSMPVFTPNPKIDYKIQVMTPDPRINYKILTVSPAQPPALTMPNPRFMGGIPQWSPGQRRK